MNCSQDDGLKQSKATGGGEDRSDRVELEESQVVSQFMVTKCSSNLVYCIIYQWFNLGVTYQIQPIQTLLNFDECYLEWNFEFDEWYLVRTNTWMMLLKLVY